MSLKKYGLIYQNENNEMTYLCSFYGRNHYKIKFVMYRYLKKILNTNKIMFSIHDVKKNDFYVYIGKNIPIKPTKIKTTKIKSINRVYQATDKQTDDFIDKFDNSEIPIDKSHNYKEQYNSDELSMSETDSEYDSE
jgi:hypothetical protein